MSITVYSGLPMPPTDPTDAVLAVLGQSGLLDAGRLAELTQWIAQVRPDPQTLAKELTRRGWLTSFQVKELYKGRSKSLFIGPYVLLDLLGEGGMGRVYKARHTRLGRDEALKVIRKEKLSNPVAVTRFQHEIRAAAQLSHPNVVVAFDSDQVNGVCFFSMEYVEGIDLTKFVRQHGPMPVPQACDAIRQAALGLQHAYEKGLVHRDIKPSNILITPRGQVKLLDLGLAMLNETPLAGGEDANRVTQEGYVLGTPDFLAPEQAQNPTTVDIRADIYGLGATLFYLITTRVPFEAATPTEKLLKHITEPPPSLLAVRPDAPPALDGLIKWLMAKRPDDRPQTPAQVAAALAPFCQMGTAAFAPNPAMPQAAPYAPQIPQAAPYATQAAPYAPPAAPYAPPAAPYAPPAAPYAPPAPQAAPYAPQAAPYGLPTAVHAEALPTADADAFAGFDANDDRDDEADEDKPGKPKKKREPGERGVRIKAPKQRSNLLLIVIGIGAVIMLVCGSGVSIMYFYGSRAYQDSRPLEDEFTNVADMKMIRVPKGSFTMGSPDGEAMRDGAEGPAGEVTLTEDFFMAATEVTRRQFLDVYGTFATKLKLGFKEKLQNQVPADSIRYTEAVEFCKKLNYKDQKSKHFRTGWEYRLPTEAEWEYVCRAGTTTPFNTGEKLTYQKHAIFDPREEDGVGELPPGFEFRTKMPFPTFTSREQAQAAGVEDKYREPNAWGFYDMHGNMAEWCQDYFEPGYPAGPRVNPTGPTTGTYRVVRGGSWTEGAAQARSASRHGKDPSTSESDIGFRVVYAKKAEKK